MWHQAKGVFQYGPGIRRAVLLVDQGIADFYRAMIPKHIRTNPQMYPAHVSVIRHELPASLLLWSAHENEEVEFSYESVIKTDDKYFWLDVQSDALMRFRVELGMSPYPWWRNRYHITVANSKGMTDVAGDAE